MMNDTWCNISRPHSRFELDKYPCTDGMGRIDAELYQIIRWWLEGVLHIIICVIGFATNLGSIRVLISHEMKNLFNITLAILAIFDTIYTVCDILESLRIVHYDETTCTEAPSYQKWHLEIFPCVLRPLRFISMLASIYTTIIISMERYVAVSRPIYSFVGQFEGAHGKWKSALLYTSPAVLFSVIFGLPRFFEFSVAPTDFICLDNHIVDRFDHSTPKELLLQVQEGIKRGKILLFEYFYSH